MKTILLATDGSECARLATTAAIELAQLTGGPLHVVTVWHAPIQVGYSIPMAIPELIADARKHAKVVALETVEQAAEAGVEATWETREGYPADEICKAARELPAGLVVLGAHGWGPVKRILIGSVSTHVLHEAPCPVLVVRADEVADELPLHKETVAGARS